MRAARRVLAAILLLAWAGGVPACLGRSPEVRHYTMSAVPGGVTAPGLGDLGIGVGPIEVPRYLERPQLVTRVGGSELAFDEFHRWAGGFESNLARVLAEGLSSRLGSGRVTLDAGTSPFPVTFQVAVDVLRFEGERGGDLVLQARWVVREPDPKGRLWMEESNIRRPVTGGDVESLVAAHDAALGELADAIAARIAHQARAAP